MTAALNDRAARTRALCEHDTTLLVEAGAGTGKTALMAGRVVRLLADGRTPGEIAAITFTELAAGELQQRIALFIDELCAGQMPVQLADAFPDGVSEPERAALEQARAGLDRLTCTTIHGFAKQLIGPYPVETGMDPGAKMIDPANADIVHEEILRRWLREHLSDAAGGGSGLIGQMLLDDPDRTMTTIRETAQLLRDHRGAEAPQATPTRADLADFEQAVATFAEKAEAADEPASRAIAGQFATLRDTLAQALARGPDDAGLLTLANPPAIAAMKKDTTRLRKWGKKTDFKKAAAARGASTGEADRMAAAAEAAYNAVDEALTGFLERASAAVSARFLSDLKGLDARYARYKRDAALMDFHDLLHAARDLLRDHPDVGDALAARYRIILVDEFQDTDPVQADILWRLSEQAPCQPADAHWTARTPEPGRLFLVADPKQSIYRFRGADVHAYLSARDGLSRARGETLNITANFRSQSGLIDWVNATFEAPLSSPDQPGFQALSPTRPDHGAPTRIAALPVTAEPSDPEKPASVDDRRRAEADAVADLCRRLVGSYEVLDPESEGGRRPCAPGDIALIAPVGSSLWLYERALETAGLPIATQAGKGAFRRQEILDLIALARVLADSRDTLALGALLRGPLVGLSEEQILDCVAVLPRDPGRPDRIPRLGVTTDPDALPDPVARHTLTVLQQLRRRARMATPFELLAEAVEELRVRPILEQRHPRSSERALANVDLFLELARPYAVRGLKAFASDMRARWSEGARQSEGRPDAQQQAVQVITMHSSKGLEWPVVIPINAMGRPQPEQGAQIDRATGLLHVQLSKTAPQTTEHARAIATNDAEVTAERARLWYVTCTRAKQLLVLPRIDPEPADGAWCHLVDFGHHNLETLDPESWPPELPARPAPPTNHQDADTFAQEAARVAAGHPVIARRTPSRHEGGHDTPAETPVFSDADAAWPDRPRAPLGSPTRGLVIHKLLEEALTGETGSDDLPERAAELLRELDLDPDAPPETGPNHQEIARVVARTLSLPLIQGLRDRLIPEYPIAASQPDADTEVITAGVADALAPGEDGTSAVVVDWKSDVAPDPGRKEGYRAQMRDYLQASGADEGWLVYVTDGQIERVR